MASYVAGTLVQVKSSFTDNTQLVAVDPTNVILKVMDGAGVESVYVYGHGKVVQPSNPFNTWTYVVGTSAFITKVSAGIYTADLDTTPTSPTNVGIWTYGWLGTGAVGQSISFNTFVVTSPPIS